MSAGAVHLHLKDESGSDTFAGPPLADVLAAVRAVSPGVSIGVTTGAWALPDPGERAAAIRSWEVVPDFASVNWHEEGADDVARVLLDRGVDVEAGLWHAGAVASWRASPRATPCRRARHVVRRLSPSCCMERVPAVGLALRIAADLGLDTRIGLEDTLALPDGTVALDNAALVSHARRRWGSWVRSGPRSSSCRRRDRAAPEPSHPRRPRAAPTWICVVTPARRGARPPVAGPPGHQVALDVLVGHPSATSRDDGVAGEGRPVPGGLHDRRPAGHSADLIEQPHPAAGAVYVHRAGQLPAQGQALAQVPVAHPVARQMDHLPCVDVRAGTQRVSRVQQRDRFADAPRTGKHRRLVGHLPGRYVLQDVGAESQVMGGTVEQ